MERRVADRTAQLRKSNVELEFEIQERKNAEETAKTSETMLKAILSASPVGIGMESPDREILWVNEAWLAIFGFENEKDCVGLNARDFYAYKSAYDLTEKAMFENGTSTKVLQMDAAMLRRDGSTFDAHLRIGAIDIGNAERGLIVTVTDVSDRKKYEKALVESESKYRTLFESAGDAIYILSMDAETQGSIISANHQAAEMHGYTLPELLELNISDLDSSESAQHIKNRMERLLEGGVVREVTTHRRKDGSIFPIELNARKMEIAGKNYVLAIDRDVTEREKAHKALLASERKMRMINDSSPIGIRVVQDNKYVYVNPAFAQMFGYNDQDEILGLSVELLYAEESRPLILERQQSRSEGKIIPSHYEAVGITKNGVPFEVEAWGTEIDYLGRAASLAFVVNVSETRSLRSQLFRAQKLEAVGTLAGGIAHDFNNILQVTLGYSDLMLREEDLSQRSKDDIQKIHEAARKGAELVKGLLTFSRKTEFSPRPINLNQRINDCRKMIERTLPKMIEIQLSLADDLLTVNADPNRIDQILMNLAVNARDAMPEGGKLIFTTENVCWTEESASRPPELIPGDYVVLHVTDNGIGMSAQTVDRIFEPFFTTKGVGEGTGLGLATVYGIVQQHGGHIQCRSDLGHGTTFTLYFPSIKREREEYCETSGSQIPVGGSETILLVDDEELIRELGAKILKRAGYKVMTASDGMQALETYSHSKESIALVLLDLMMPRMGGKQCLDILLRFDSNIKVVIASGFSSGSEIKDSLERGAKAFVRKPYDGYEILQIIRKVLDERL
jgi:PAS domain S-box-containing protein